MMIKNITRNLLISDNVRFCGDIFSKVTGLMLSRRGKLSLILTFKREEKISLHMFFVFYPIDVLFLDKKKIVVDIKENFKPFSFYTSRKRSKYAIELPLAAIKNTNTRIGDKISF